MFDYIFGLPMHALVIHAVVVLVPLSALCAIAYVVRPGVAAAAALADGCRCRRLRASRRSSRPRAVRPCSAGCRRCAPARRTSTCWPSTSSGATAPSSSACSSWSSPSLALWFVRPPEEESPRGHAFDVLIGTLVVLSAVAAIITVVLAGHAGSLVVWNGLA